MRCSCGEPWALPARLAALGLAAVLIVMLDLSSARFSSAVAQQQKAGTRPISVGYVRHAYGAWTARIADGTFETATGRTMRWRAFDTDSAAAAAMASSQIDMALIGAGVAAASFARGLDIRIFYVLGATGESEGLVLQKTLAVQPGEPKGLQNKVVAVPFGSTAHLRLLQSLKRWGLAPSSVRLVNLQYAQILDAWSRREIDAAAVSSPMLDHIARDGTALPLPATGGQEGLMVFAADGAFLAEHTVFLARFVDVIARAEAASAEQGPATAERRDVKSIAFLTGLEPQAVAGALARYRPPPLDKQATPQWLGGGAQSALAAELKANAEVWRWGGRIDRAADHDFSQAISAEPVEQALTYQN